MPTGAKSRKIVLHIDPDREPDRARHAFESHLARAKWMTEHGYRHLLRGGASARRTSAERLPTARIEFLRYVVATVVHRAMHNQGLAATLKREDHSGAILGAHVGVGRKCLILTGESPEVYERAQDAEITGFAWECLRRNPDYQRDL